jgi:hypothetical protein
MPELPISIVHVDTPAGPRDFVTCLPHDVVFQRGLRPEAILGTLMKPAGEGVAISPDNFARNPAFVEFMHAVIANRGPELAGLKGAAAQQGNGSIFIVDQRTATPQGAVPPEDIVGAFAVKEGKLVPNSYQRSPNHRIFTARGFFQLGAELQPLLLEELNKLE